MEARNDPRQRLEGRDSVRRDGGGLEGWGAAARWIKARSIVCYALRYACVQIAGWCCRMGESSTAAIAAVAVDFACTGLRS
jgi:hypothetical protein